MLASLASRRAAKTAAVNERLNVLEKEAHETNERLRRLYKLVEDGVTQMDDLLKERINSLKADRDRAAAALERARSAVRPAV
jgi:site-specific DNA recombinase